MTSEAASAPPAPPWHRMVLTIAGKELREILRDGRFLWSAAIMAALLLAALVTGWARYADYQAMTVAAQGTANAQFYNQGDKNPHSAAHYGNYALKQRSPLSFFDNGIEPYAGSFIFLEAHKQNLALSPPASDLSAITRFGELTGASILQLLLPLLIIFLGFSAFAGERERGTLRQLLAAGVSRERLLAGKALGIAAATALVVLPCIGLAGLLIALIGAPAGEALGARIGLMAAGYTVYAAIFLFLSLAVSALAPSPRAALILLVGFWAFCVFLMPKAAVEISKQLVPTPSLGEFEIALAETRRTGLGGPPPRARLAAYRQQLLEQYGVENTADLPVYWVSTMMQKMEEIDHEFFDHFHRGLAGSYLAQRRLQDRLGLLAPVLPLSSLSMGLAGTDLLHQARFTEAAETQRRRMVTEMNDYLSNEAAAFNANQNLGPNVSTETNDRVMIADEAVFRRVPPFAYQPPPLAAVLDEYRVSFVILALWLVLAIAAAGFAVRRLQPQRG